MPASRYIFGTIPWYSVLIIAGVCCAILVAEREVKRQGLPRDTAVDLALCLVPSGIVGARLYYVAFAWDLFRDDPVSILYVWNGGLAIYGGIIAGLLAAVVYARCKRLPVLQILDLLAPSVVLAQAVGRWGNFFNMEAYGAPVTVPFWQFFPAAVLIPGTDGAVWHMATFFYESMWDLSVFLVLALLRRKPHRRGSIVCWYALLYGAGRLIIEGLRMDSLMTTGGNGRVSQLLSVGLCLAVVAIFAVPVVRRANRHAFVCAGMVAAFCLMLCLLLPVPQDAFFQGNAAWAVLFVGGVGCCVMRLARDHRQSGPSRAIVPLTIPFCAVAVRTAIALRGFSGLGPNTLNCALYSLTAIAFAGYLYPSYHPDQPDVARRPL